ncbi:MAG: NAD(P)-dependent alcohol dehydrogenase [Oscillospiraceae bacterium]|nr:NAD(P)-dependent alcohol dehydrogenase [Oscillospiraceae bacterium]
MKAAPLKELQKIVVEERPRPRPAAGEVLVKIEYCGICGSDAEFFEAGHIGSRTVNYPLVLGHEAAGEIVELGEGVAKYQAGQKVVIEPGIPCGHCEFCRQGRYNICRSMKFLSCPPDDGLFCEYVAVPADTVFLLPDGMTTLTGALMEPLAVGMHAARTGEVEAPKTVVILGAGCIGLCTLLCCRQRGAGKIIVSDLFEKRLSLARELGADEIVDASKCDAQAEILRLTGGEGADVVFETAGNRVTTAQTSWIAKRGGTIVIVGNVQGDVPFHFRNLCTAEIQLKTIKRYCNDFQVCLSAINNGGIPVEKLEKIVDRIYPLEEIQEAFTQFIENKKDLTKIVIKVQ